MYWSPAAGGAIQSGIMYDNRIAVTAESHITLDSIGSYIKSQCKGEQRILRRMGASTAMGVTDYLTSCHHHL
jgi:hypothetical protein